MTCELKQYQSDGANFQAKSVLAAVQYLSYNLEEWKVTRWENGRERGYTIYRRVYTDSSPVQLNVTFCEHRNSDDIVVYTWLKSTFNPPTLSDISDEEGSDWIKHYRKHFGRLEIGCTANYIKGLMNGFDTMLEAKEYSFLPTLINGTDPNQN